MAIKITDECINCGACEPECPNNAIYEGGVEWAMADGTSLKGAYTLMDGTSVDAGARIAPVAMDTYYITHAQNVKVFMKNLSVQLFVRLTVVCQTSYTKKQLMNY
jgi:ferredoxin